MGKKYQKEKNGIKRNGCQEVKKGAKVAPKGGYGQRLGNGDSGVWGRVEVEIEGEGKRGKGLI